MPTDIFQPDALAGKSVLVMGGGSGLGKEISKGLFALGAWEKLNPLPDTKSSVTSDDTVPLGRFGRMHELQSLITFLLSDGCNYLTGQTIAIDGGQHLAGPGTDKCIELFMEGKLDAVDADARIVKIAGGSIEVMKTIISREMFKGRLKDRKVA